MDVLKAQALYGTKKPDEQEKAISLIMHLLPDLQAPMLNLTLYCCTPRLHMIGGRRARL